MVPIDQRKEIPADPEGHGGDRQDGDHHAADAEQEPEGNFEDPSGRISGSETKHTESRIRIERLNLNSPF